MATKLSALLKSKSGGVAVSPTEQNIERGKIYSFSPGSICSNFYNGFCFIAPSNGTAVIEVWGASGSSARMCCCGGGIPGNAGAYAKKTITMTAGQYICGYTGKSCGNGDSLCFRGCSEYSGLVWCGCGNQTGCICAQGGMGGFSMCSTGTSLWCCFINQGFCGTQSPSGCDNCGVICNWRGSCLGMGYQHWMACAFGGDINCCGGFSCTSFFGCYPQCICYFHQHIRTSAGIFAQGGAQITFGTENTNGMGNWSGQGWHQLHHGLSAASRWPVGGNPYAACWQGAVSCGCYESNGCIKSIPVGVPGPPGWPCGDVRDQAFSGGDGAVRIRFY